MNIKTKFNLGDRVFYISGVGCEYMVKCLTCNQTGQITINSETFICPKCKGESKHKKWAGNKAVVYDEFNIGKIDVEVYPENNVRCGHSGIEIKYMDNSTGSGSCYHEKDLFSTRAAAEAECVKRNKSLPKDEI